MDEGSEDADLKFELRDDDLSRIRHSQSFEEDQLQPTPIVVQDKKPKT